MVRIYKTETFNRNNCWAQRTNRNDSNRLCNLNKFRLLKCVTVSNWIYFFIFSSTSYFHLLLRHCISGKSKRTEKEKPKQKSWQMRRIWIEATDVKNIQRAQEKLWQPPMAMHFLQNSLIRCCLFQSLFIDCFGFFIPLFTSRRVLAHF